MKPTSLLLLSILAGCGMPASPTTARSTEALRVATYNLNYGLAGDPDTVAAIADTDADVLVLQEVSAAWARSLDRARWPHACFARSEYPAGGGAILSRLPLRDCARSPSDVGWFPALAATIAGPFGDVRVVNVHLQPARAGVQVLADLTALPELHRREVSTHLARLGDASLPTVLAGDFNEGDGEGGFFELTSRGYASALASHAPGATTWRWPLGLMTMHKRLDHVMYDPDELRCVSARVLNAGRSDHLPVVARFTLPTLPALPIGSSLVSGDQRRSAHTPR